MSNRNNENGFGIGRVNAFLSSGGPFASGLDFCRLFAVPPGKKFAVTASYSPPVDAQGRLDYVFLDGNLQPARGTDPDGFYHGASPEFDAEEVIRAVSALRFSNQLNIDSYLAERGRWFMIRSGQHEHLASMARLVTVSVASLFGIHVEAETDFVAEVKSAAGENPNALIVSDGATMTLRGCPTDSMLTVLRRAGYEATKNGWRVTSHGKGMSIDEVYRGGNVGILSGESFYPGVLLRPVEIGVGNNGMSNKAVSSIVFKFERSTYSVVVALDRNYSSHPVFSREARDGIVAMICEDDFRKATLMRQLSDECLSEDAWWCCSLPEKEMPRPFRAINEYLAKSINVNQICVAADIDSSDNVEVFGIRDPAAIDGGAFYPSANGNAEIADGRVSHYRLSVGEDTPTIKMSENVRLGFEGEIAREIEAELDISASGKKLDSSGFVLLGNHPPPDSPNKMLHDVPRRMHFTVLFKQVSSEPFADVVKRCANAVERFENRDFIGLVLTCWSNRWSRVVRTLGCILGFVASQKELFESLLLISFAAVSLFVWKRVGDNSFGAVEALQGILAIIVTIVSIYEIFVALAKRHRLNRRIHRIGFYSFESPETVVGRVERHFPKKSCHPAAYACLLMRIQSLFSARSAKR